MKNMIKELEKTIREQLNHTRDSENPDKASWGYEQGILLTVNEGKAVLDLIQKRASAREELIKERSCRLFFIEDHDCMQHAEQCQMVVLIERINEVMGDGKK